MTVVGIITEYNPFHEGHLLHLSHAKAMGNAVVCVMSGNFVQRGEPSVYDKFTRAAFAASQGVDLVLELPLCYSLASAPGFAYGAVATLAATGMVDTILFGSECGDIDRLYAASESLTDADIQKNIGVHLAEGMTYPAARAKALETFSDVFSSPNNSLGIEYLLALKSINSSITAKTMKRLPDAPSATKIRTSLWENKTPDGMLMPQMQTPVALQDFEAMLMYALRATAKEELLCYTDVNDELAARLMEGGRLATLSHAIEYIKTKRYTMSRVKRILFNILTKNCISPQTPPAYIRVLSMTKRGASLLGQMQEKASVPVYTKLPKENLPPMLQKDIFATDIYMLAKKAPAGMDYTKKIFVCPR